ncbi:MAG: I78 family peptidase inhibitor [Pseudomonadota bacterium]
MKLNVPLLLAPSIMALSASAVTAQDTPALCEAEPGQAYVGGPATQETGAAIMAATGATIFQWVLEGSPVTKDYRRERVRVVYSREMQIVSVTCG